MDYLEQAKKVFCNDRFATDATGIVIEAVEENYAKCSLKIEPKHLNAVNSVMGGAIFTLADFAFAIASNTPNFGSVSLNSQINYLTAPKGKTLFAETKVLKAGRKVCFFAIEITDDLGTKVATVNTTGYYVKQA